MAAWNRVELLQAQREGATLEVAPGVAGCRILEVRRDDFVVVALPFPGTAYVRFECVRTPAPVRLPLGAPVSTPYGKATVTGVRHDEERGVSYAVSFAEMRLANDTRAVGYLAPRDVAAREELLLSECLEAAEGLRTRGNAEYKVRGRRWGCGGGGLR